jgi:hypothetical protein
MGFVSVQVSLIFFIFYFIVQCSKLEICCKTVFEKVS